MMFNKRVKIVLSFQNDKVMDKLMSAEYKLDFYSFIRNCIEIMTR